MSDYASEFSIRRLWIIFGASMVDHVRRPALLRRPDLSRQAADAGRGADRLRANPLHGRGHPARPGGLAIDRRDAAGLDLGPWRLCRARLERGLAASRGDRAARPDRRNRRRRRSRRWPNPTRRGSAPCSGARCAPTATIREPSAITVSDQRAAAIAATAAHYEDLFTNRTPADQHLRELYAMPQNAVADRGRGACAGRLLLLDVLGDRGRAARRHDQLYQQLAA